MKPEAANYLDKARRALKEGHAVAGIELAEAAGRAAYLAAFHAAQAFIFDRTGRIAKTRSGVRSEFARLAKDEPRIDRTLPAFLGQAYKFKSVADYSVGPDAVVTLSEASEAVTSAARFVERIAELVAPSKRIRGRSRGTKT